MIKAPTPLKRFVKTIAYDNRKEFVEHEKVAKSLGCNSYFASPCHSWEHGQGVREVNWSG